MPRKSTQVAIFQPPPPPAIVVFNHDQTFYSQSLPDVISRISDYPKLNHDIEFFQGELIDVSALKCLFIDGIRYDRYALFVLVGRETDFRALVSLLQKKALWWVFAECQIIDETNGQILYKTRDTKLFFQRIMPYLWDRRMQVIFDEDPNVAPRFVSQPVQPRPYQIAASASSSFSSPFTEGSNNQTISLPSEQQIFED